MAPNIVGLIVAGVIFMILGGIVLWILGPICLIGGIGALLATRQGRRRAPAQRFSLSARFPATS